MVGGPAQPGHRGVQQRAGRLRDRLEDLAIEGAETLADLGQAAQALWLSTESHDANLPSRRAAQPGLIVCNHGACADGWTA